jgi:VanZ family protein
LFVALTGFAMWLAVIGPVRGASASLRTNWLVGVAPSFLAAVTFAFWQAFATRSRAAAAALYATALIVVTETVQLFLPRYRADFGDVIAGVLGAALAYAILRRLERTTLPR